MTRGYASDLAYIHDVGFGNFAEHSAKFLLRLLAHRGQAKLHSPLAPLAGRGTGGEGQKLIIDLGCGSGILARELVAAGYRVLGIDHSPAMIAIAREKAPGADFQTGSCLNAEIPRCVAVTAIGEIFSYLFDRGNNSRSLLKLFHRVYGALERGGLFVFDVAAPGRAGGAGEQKSYREGADWAVLVTTKEDDGRRLLTRLITSFRQVGRHYRRDEEVHELRLFERADLTGQLRSVGFRVRPLAGYGQLRFVRGHIGFLARKV